MTFLLGWKTLYLAFTLSRNVCVCVCCTHLPLIELMLRPAPLLLQTFLHFLADLPSQLRLVHCSEEKENKVACKHKATRSDSVVVVNMRKQKRAESCHALAARAAIKTSLHYAYLLKTHTQLAAYVTNTHSYILFLAW